MSRRGFTLIELLVVIAIVAVLAVTVILTLNPAELLKQARDSTRLSDLSGLNTALATYLADVPSPTTGATSTVYVSLPDSSSSCANHALPTLPSGWAYACASSSNYRNTNGSGWIPVNFSQLSSGSPLAQLPIDPQNNAATVAYYTYVTDGIGGYALSSSFESARQQTTVRQDGGLNPFRYETGSSVALLAPSEGLIGYWSFDEGSGSTVADGSGNGLHGTWLGANPHWTTGKLGSGGLFANNAANYVNLGTSPALNPPQITMSAWVYFNTVSAAVGILTNKYSPAYGLNLGAGNTTARSLSTLVGDGTTYIYAASPTVPSTGVWYQLTVTHDGSIVRTYVDGIQVASGAKNLGYYSPQSVTAIGCFYFNTGCASSHDGVIDEVRIYNRALTPGEVRALYNAER